jgi:cytochrome c556
MMRWSVFIVIQCLIILMLIGVFYSHQNHMILLKEPPTSLSQWYKPQNKRQVWLHTMFRLRRETLAIEIYALSKDDKNLRKWMEKLSKDYREIKEMVPEWEARLDLAVINELQANVNDKRYEEVIQSLLELDKNCEACHTDFRTVTASLYRAPDFSNIKIDGSTSLKLHMRTMSKQVNQIKIAYMDGKQDTALTAYRQLEKEMNRLGDTCSTCHKDSSQSYPNDLMISAMSDLEQSLKTGTIKDQGKALGTLAVMVCADCHGTHRLAYDVKELLGKSENWRELLKHNF